jgi:hypothetical protein
MANHDLVFTLLRLVGASAASIPAARRAAPNLWAISPTWPYVFQLPASFSEFLDLFGLPAKELAAAHALVVRKLFKDVLSQIVQGLGTRNGGGSQISLVLGLDSMRFVIVHRNGFQFLAAGQLFNNSQPSKGDQGNLENCKHGCRRKRESNRQNFM